MRDYNRKKPFNKIKEEYLKKLELHLKKIEQLKDGNTNDRQE